MSKTLNVTNERVDDIPLLCAFLKEMGGQSLLDQHFPTHGNWQGLSLGWVAVVWLSYNPQSLSSNTANSIYIVCSKSFRSDRPSCSNVIN